MYLFQIIQQHREDSERKGQLLKEKDLVIEQREQMLEQNYYELEMKTKEVEDLHRHVKSLQAALERKQKCEKQGELINSPWYLFGSLYY